MHLSLLASSLRNYGDIWAPAGEEISVVNPNLSGTKEMVYSWQIVSLEDNFVPPSGTFSLKFPVGTRAFDDINQRSFIAGKAVVVRAKSNLDTLYYAPFENYPDLVQLTDYSAGLSERDWENSRTYQNVSALSEPPSELTPPQQNLRLQPTDIQNPPPVGPNTAPNTGPEPGFVPTWNIGGFALLVVVAILIVGGILIVSKQRSQKP
jgi:hypothetical protein